LKIPLSAPDIGDLEIEYVTRVLRSNQLSLGPVLTEFEEQFARYAGTKYAIACSSGTAALHMCVRALDLGSEAEVITSSFSFVASVN
jgi:perosamine synthetase